MAADLADRVDDVLAHLLGELRELLLGELVQVLGAVDLCRAGSRGARVDEVGDLLELGGRMIRLRRRPDGSGRADRSATSASAARAVRCDSAASSLARSMPYSLTYVRLPWRSSLPLGFPSAASVPVTSSMSSTIWKRTPSSAAKRRNGTGPRSVSLHPSTVVRRAPRRRSDGRSSARAAGAGPRDPAACARSRRRIARPPCRSRRSQRRAPRRPAAAARGAARCWVSR